MSIALEIPITYFKERDVNAYYEQLQLYFIIFNFIDIFKM